MVRSILLLYRGPPAALEAKCEAGRGWELGWLLGKAEEDRNAGGGPGAAPMGHLDRMGVGEGQGLENGGMAG